MSKVSKRYLDRLKNYLEWSVCTTPASDFQKSKIARPSLRDAPGDMTAAEWLSEYETHGRVKIDPADAAEAALLERYWNGKANRDWWTKEHGWWSKHASAIPEEFLVHLHPLCFIELFGRAPITELVRYYYDNHYSLLAFRMDTWVKSYLPKVPYFERNERDTWQRTLWRLAWVRYIDPTLWKLRRRLHRRKA